MTRYPFAEWKYQDEYDITNVPTQDGYQVELVIPWRPGMRRDFRDLRFRDPALRKCPYWIETKTDGATATVRVRIPLLGTKRLHVLYGNPAAVSESSGSATMDFFDDFLGSSIDSALWNRSATQVAVSNSIATVTGSGTTGYIASKNIAFPGGSGRVASYRVRHANTGNAASEIIVSYRGASGGDFYSFGADKNSPSYGGRHTRYTTAYDNLAALSVPAANTWKTISHYFYATGFKAGCNGAIDYASTSITGNQPFGVEIAAAYAGGQVEVDWIYVRKYQPTEPVLTRARSGLNPWSIAVRRPRSFEYGAPSGGPTYSESGQAALYWSGSASSLAAFHQTGHASLLYGATPAPTARIFVDFMDQRVESITVRRNISEVLWRAEATINGLTPVSHDVLRQVNIDLPDHLGGLQRVFYGVAPNNQITQQPAKNRTKVTCYDYGWHLTQRVVPPALRAIPATTSPEVAIAALLGGADWEAETGVKPELLVPATAWGTTVSARVMTFPRTTTRMAAIQAYCELLNYCFFVLLRTGDDGRTIPSAFFVPEDDIDTVLNLPDPITITNPDPYLEGSPFTIDQRGDEKYNRVIVEGMTADRTPLIAIAETADVTAKEEIPLEYTDPRTDWDTQEKVDARAAELLDYFQNEGQAYRCTFVKRSDLRLFQQIRFIGWSHVPEVWMRIIDIEYRYTPAKVLVVISFSPNLKMSEVRRLLRSMNPTQVGEVENLIDNKLSTIQGNRVGTVTAINGTTATVTLDSGETVEGLIR